MIEKLKLIWCWLRGYTWRPYGTNRGVGITNERAGMSLHPITPLPWCVALAVCRRLNASVELRASAWGEAELAEIKAVLAEAQDEHQERQL